MRLSHAWLAVTPVFDDAGLVSFAGLVPVVGLAQAAGLDDLVAERVDLGSTRARSAGVSPAGKVAAIVAEMACGADSIDDPRPERDTPRPQRPRQRSASPPTAVPLLLQPPIQGHDDRMAAVSTLR